MTEFHYVKTSYSRPWGSGSCVEVAANVVGVRAIRDSKDPDGPHLEFTPGELATFVGALKRGVMDQR